ncbi:uncharacterized protein LODBEIA_P54220 [Lodderomyces beijingensis]|uniref:Translation initiation factor eIF4e n=1 Tax=Lodderomyces beijingensis TaxID=1775926 RepID=A0ABP0ZST7_9ASCO
MSDNLKRAESLFNRIIMNQGADLSPTVSASSGASTPSFPPRSKHHHNNHHQHNSHDNNNNNNSNNNGSRNHYNNHHHGSSSSHAPVIEFSKLPKLDVQKLTQEALASVSVSDHVLAYCWTVWHHSRNKKPAAQVAAAATSAVESDAAQVGVDSYLQTTNQVQFTHQSQDSSSSTTISHVASVEQMWTMLTSIKNSFKLAIGTEFLIFKTGVNPAWEDPVNAKGGRWIFRFARKSQDQKELQQGSGGGGDALSPCQSVEKLRKRSALVWERLVLKILTGNFIPNSQSLELQNVLLNDICGIVLSVRKDEDIISVWNSNLNFSKKQLEKLSAATSTSGANTSPLSAFQARRVICDAILRVIRECDSIIDGGSDGVTTSDSGANERVWGVSFEYRLHVEAPHGGGATNGGGEGSNVNSGNSNRERGGGKNNNRYHNHNHNSHHHHNHQHHQNHHGHHKSSSLLPSSSSSSSSTTSARQAAAN